MLGESEVWRDFSSHFSSELDKICTVLLPHHGAAPRTGAKFYNRALNTAPGIFSVLSYGKNNREGHPTTEVVDGILIGKGIFTSVTEDTLTGFVEIIRSH
jgi:beta-lactamase superfamily II metal-dependent hydrolase